MRSGGVLVPERAALRLDHVDLAVEILPGEEALKGVATLTITTSAPQTRLLIDLDRNLPVSAVSIDGKALAPGAWTNPDGQLVITLPRPAAAGAKLVARIAYGGRPHVAVNPPWDDGLVWARTADGKPWVATTAQGYGCDLFWPCLDFPQGEPGGATIHVTVPAGLSAPSNGVLTGVDRLPDGRSTWHWKSGPINPYNITLAAGPYSELSARYRSRFGNFIPLSFWHIGRDAQARELFAEFRPTLDFFEKFVGPYPWGKEKLAIVETPHLGMEHQTLNAYGNNYANDGNGFDWLFQHELAHEWFGNQMTVANWDDFWLHEGYAQYMQPLYGRTIGGEAQYKRMMAEFRAMIVNNAPLVSGRVRIEEEVYEEALGGPAGDIYYKGAWMLHTLRNTIGDKAFWEVTRRIVYGRPDPRPGNFKPRFASTAEFVAIVNQVTGRDYGWFFDVYLRQAALPRLEAVHTGDVLKLAWKAPGGKPFPLPVEVAVRGSIIKVGMQGGTGVVKVPAGVIPVVDPEAKLLKR
ncbi:M1 family metallopeptidase [Sphingomonas canadensis]|uniref:Aminopeptidase N n=1 Tax=Sphingomonas canadensis TaxID=1219257 RepID=A0ABW3H8M9_9SPHN|nr:M1 family metallopeptidase [Sphingomonas canadensis]MCW3835532.1 M1 family metallopeptidase [Sphingomonas canadensis]